jgi:hypothetical protein
LSLSPGPAFVPTASGYPADNPARRELEANINNLSASLINDTQTEFVGTVTINLRDFVGKVLETVTEAATISPNGVWKSQKNLTVTERTDAFVHVVFTGEDGTLLAENTQFLAEPKDLALPKSKINVSFSEVSEDSITLTSQSLAAFVWVRFVGEKVTLSDNGFHLLPGKTKTITVKNIKNSNLSSIIDKLVVRSL